MSAEILSFETGRPAEIADDDDLIVLHKGKILAHGPVAGIAASGEGVSAAFTRLTQGADATSEAA